MKEIHIDKKPPKNKQVELKADLCLDKVPTLNSALQSALVKKLVPALSAYGTVTAAVLPASPGRYSSGLLVTLEGLLPGENGRPGISVTFGDHATARDDEDLLQSLAQTWQWDEAENALFAAPYRVGLRSVNSLELPVNDRIALVQKSLRALAEVLRPAALIFPQSQCCVDPAAYLENDPAGDDYFALYGLVNVRVFTAEGKEDSEDAEAGSHVFMDTLGMHALGLDDAQCLADAGADGADLAYWLYNLAEYMRETPGEFEDGDVIVGPDEAEWELGYTTALIGPQRRVLNVDTLLEDPEFPPAGQE